MEFDLPTPDDIKEEQQKEGVKCPGCGGKGCVYCKQGRCGAEPEGRVDPDNIVIPAHRK